MGRHAGKLAAAGAGVSLAGMAGGLALGIRNGSVVDPIGHAAILLALLAFAAAGAVVAARRPRNAVGWLYLAVGMLAGVGAFAQEYAIYALVVRGQTLPGAIGAAWVADWAWYPLIAFALLVAPLLFPDGRPPSPRWRPLVWLATALVVFMTAHAALAERVRVSTADETLTIPNPVGVAGVTSLEDSAVGMAVTNGAGLVLVVAIIAALVVRFRRSAGDERAQVKWFLAAVAFVLGCIVLIELLDAAGVGLGERLGDAVFGVLLALIPASVGIAVLKYRLYDIDRIISRTVAYGLLTGLLVAVYLLVVMGLQQALRPVMGDSQLAVAGATLVVAGLFQPARRRIQAAVDRRFDRARYDAQRTVETFRARLRDKLDIDELTTELVSTADAAVAPATAHVWLHRREPTRAVNRYPTEPSR